MSNEVDVLRVVTREGVPKLKWNHAIFDDISIAAFGIRGSTAVPLMVYRGKHERKWTGESHFVAMSSLHNCPALFLEIHGQRAHPPLSRLSADFFKPGDVIVLGAFPQRLTKSAIRQHARRRKKA